MWTAHHQSCDRHTKLITCTGWTCWAWVFNTATDHITHNFQSSHFCLYTFYHNEWMQNVTLDFLSILFIIIYQLKHIFVFWTEPICFNFSDIKATSNALIVILFSTSTPYVGHLNSEGTRSVRNQLHKSKSFAFERPGLTWSDPRKLGHTQPFYSHYTGQPVVSWHIEGLHWSIVLLLACPCWRQLVHSD